MAMPDSPSVRVADLFRMRNADRLGLQVGDNDRMRDAELTQFGDSIGVAARGGPAAAQQPAQVATMQQQPTAPPQPAQAPMSGMRAVDAVPKVPQKPTRGIYHNRKMGRVMGPGG